MKSILLSACLFLTISSIAQNNDPHAVVAEIKKIFSKVPKGKYADLVPYAVNGKWGFIDRVNKKVLVEPVFSSPYFFHPGINIYYKNTDIDISSTGEVTLVPEQPQVMMDVVEESPGFGQDPKVRHYTDGFKGFTTYPNGELAYYSDLYQYNKQGIPGWNIQIVKYQDRYLGIVKNLQGKSGIIEQNGTPVKGFDFNFSDIHPNRGCLDSVHAWFYVKKNETDNYSLMNINGEVKLANEIFSYPLLSSRLFAYTPYIKGDTSSVFDNYLMKWLVKPQTKLRILNLYFSSATQLQNDEPVNRDRVFIYYQVQEGDRSYFMDLKGVKYLPKK